MTEEICDLTYLIKCSLWDEIPEIDALHQKKDIKGYWINMLGIAQTLKLLPFLQYALKLGQGLNCPDDIYLNQLEKLRTMALNRICSAELLADFQGQLEELGIENVVMKGQALATSYKRPELRSGCDVDLYVDESDEKVVYDWAQRKGFAMEKRVPGTHHGEIWHPTIGLIELHVMLCNADESLVEGAKAKDVFLIHPKEDFVSLFNLGHPIKTLGMTDHMIFIVAHMINHYLHGEATPRMLIDVNEFFGAYRDQMDLPRLRSDLKTLKYDKFFATVLLIGEEFFGFSHDKNWTSDVKKEDALKLLEDFCICDRQKEDAIATYDAYCKGNAGSGIEALGLKLSILKSNIRTAWQLRHKMRLSSIFSIGIKRIANLFLPKTKEGSDENSSIVKNRMELLRQLDLI